MTERPDDDGGQPGGSSPRRPRSTLDSAAVFVQAEYVPPGTAEAERLSARAGERFSAALTNNARGDNYSLLTVLFALVHFLAAMLQRDIPTVGRRVLIGAGAFAALGVVLVATFPIKL